MTAPPAPDHSHPEYVTHADLEAFEGRLITRIAELEARVSRDINTAFWRQLLALLEGLMDESKASTEAMDRARAEIDSLRAYNEMLLRIEREHVAQAARLRAALESARTVLREIQGEGVGGEEGMRVIGTVLREISLALK